MTKETKKEVISWVQTIAIAVIIALLINNFVIVNATIPTGSMKDTINENDRVVAFRWSYLFGDPKRGDIIVFKFPDNEKELFVKRVIGMPGDKINIVQGKVYLNGATEPLDEPYLRETPDPIDFGPYEVPKDHYFMLGDNRNNSKDSRLWINTYVDKSKILGRAFLKYFPSIKILK